MGRCCFGEAVRERWRRESDLGRREKKEKRKIKKNEKKNEKGKRKEKLSRLGVPRVKFPVELFNFFKIPI